MFPQSIQKATPANYHTMASPVHGNGFSRAVNAARFQVGRIGGLLAKTPAAFGRSLIGHDSFTNQVSRQAKGY